MGGKKRVLHPTDFSEASQPAFTVALDTARRHDAELILVHVLEPIPPLEDEISMAGTFGGREAAEAAARKDFDGLLELAKKAGVAASDVLTEGSAPAEIARIAKQWHADLIVMGTHGRTGMRTVFLGSVAERVIATAPCWVFTVRM